jgi:hypothetical protein
MQSPQPISSLPPSSGPSADQQMTADRAERKYVLSMASANQLSRELSRRLDRHYPPEFLALPGTRQFATTIYFDTADRQLFCAAEQGSVKLRAREYYNVDPSLAQVVRRPEDLVRFDPVIWFELKAKDGDHVTKQRFGLPKREVPQFLAEGAFSPKSVALQSSKYGAKAEQLIEDVTRLYRRFNQPFRVDCVVNYRRVAWQNPTGTLRLTLDRQVSFFGPGDDLWDRRAPLIRETLGQVFGHAGGAVLEVKLRTPPPSWLSEIVTQLAGLPCNFSKFVAASRAVHG